MPSPCMYATVRTIPDTRDSVVRPILVLDTLDMCLCVCYVCEYVTCLDLQARAAERVFFVVACVWT
jgi:hypothetical protein